MPTLLKGAVHSLTALLGFSPKRRLTCSNAPPLVSTRSKHPMSIITGAISLSWSTRGTYLPEDCHISLYNSENFIFLTDSHLYKTCRVNIFQVPVFLYRS